MSTIIFAGQGAGFRINANPTEDSTTQTAQVVIVSRSGVKTLAVKDATQVQHAA